MNGSVKRRLLCTACFLFGIGWPIVGYLYLESTGNMGSITVAIQVILLLSVMLYLVALIVADGRVSYRNPPGYWMIFLAVGPAGASLVAVLVVLGTWAVELVNYLRGTPST